MTTEPIPAIFAKQGRPNQSRARAAVFLVILVNSNQIEVRPRVMIALLRVLRLDRLLVSFSQNAFDGKDICMYFRYLLS